MLKKVKVKVASKEKSQNSPLETPKKERWIDGMCTGCGYDPVHEEIFTPRYTKHFFNGMEQYKFWEEWNYCPKCGAPMIKYNGR